MEISVDQILRNGATVSSGIYILVTSPWQTSIASHSLNIELAVLDCIIDLYWCALFAFWTGAILTFDLRSVARHVLLCSPHPYLLQVPSKQATVRRKEQGMVIIYA
jgi:hypothetical protein